MTSKKLKKKLVVTSLQYGLSESDLITDSNEKTKAMAEYPAIVTTPDPTPAVMLTKIDNVQTNVLKRDLLLQEVKDVTVQINTGLDEIKSIFVDKWAKQIQDAVGEDTGKVKLLKFGIKGIDDGHATPAITVFNSHPVIHSINNSTHLQHLLDIVNSETKKTPLPFGAKHLDVYAFIGDEEPTDIKKMQYLGVAKKGKYTNHLDAAQIGESVWYIAVYIDKKALEPQQLSAALKSTIV
jgi:hypothetical protein